MNKSGKISRKNSCLSIFVTGFLGLCCITSLFPSENSSEIQSNSTNSLIAAVPSQTEEQEPTSTAGPSRTQTVQALLTSASMAQTEAGYSQTPIPYPTCISPAEPYELAQVIRVIDGDTIEVITNGNIERVRYIGMDTPELDQQFGSEAAIANSNLVENQTVTLYKDYSERDQYGRLLRYVFVDGIFVNLELIYAGFAEAIRYEPDTRCALDFEAAEQHAIQSSLGLWPLALAASQSTPSGNQENSVTGSPNIVITLIHYDGDVPTVESDEYVTITNNGDSTTNLEGWRLDADDPGQIFVFPSFNLESGQSCRVYTNELHSDTCGFSFRISKAIWSNDGECGRLFDASGNLMSEYCY